jgi:uncharacterized phage-associated protein
MSTWKLQKLVYYSQAWHLAWDGVELFPEPIQAWANGPVTPTLYRQHRGRFSVDTWELGDARKLTKDEKETIDLVLQGYGSLTGRQLSLLTHNEAPWQDARAGLRPTDPSKREISSESMQAFYGALDLDENAQPISEIDWTAIGDA